MPTFAPILHHSGKRSITTEFIKIYFEHKQLALWLPGFSAPIAQRSSFVPTFDLNYITIWSIGKAFHYESIQPCGHQGFRTILAPRTFMLGQFQLTQEFFPLLQLLVPKRVEQL